jgi:hypothetical protein
LRGSFLLNSSVGRRFFNAFAKKIGSLNPARPTEIVSQKFIRQLPPYGPVIKISSWQKVTLACAVTLFCLIYGAAFALFVPFLLAPLIVPFLFLTLMVIWALPNSLNVAEYILTPLLYILFLAIVLWPSYLAVAIPNLPRITIVRLIGVTLTIFALLSLSTSNKFKSQLSIVMQSCKILCTVIIMLAVIETGSILFSGNKSNSLNVYITDTINSTVVFFVACYSFSSTGKAKSFAGLLCIMALCLSLIAFWEQRIGHLPWLGHIPSFLQINDPTISRILAGTARQGKGHRTQATFTTSLGLAEYLGLCMPFLFFFATEPSTKVVKGAALCSIPLVLLATVTTQARTGLLGIAVAVLVYPVLWVFLEWRRNKNSFAIYALVASAPAFLAAGLAAALTIPGIRIRLLGGGGEQESSQARIVQMHMGLPKVLTHPWGYGIGQGGEVLGYTNAEGLLSIDSYPLRVILEFGIIGFVVWICIYVAALYYAFTGAINSKKGDEFRIFMPITVVILSYLLMKVNFAQEDNQPVIYVIFGMLTAMFYRQRKALKLVN